MTYSYLAKTFPMVSEPYLESHLFGRKGSWGGIAHDNRRFSMRYCGFCAQVHRGETCRPTMEIGKIPIGAFAVGAITESGKGCLSRSFRGLNRSFRPSRT